MQFIPTTFLFAFVFILCKLPQKEASEVDDLNSKGSKEIPSGTAKSNKDSQNGSSKGSESTNATAVGRASQSKGASRASGSASATSKGSHSRSSSSASAKASAYSETGMSSSSQSDSAGSSSANGKYNGFAQDYNAQQYFDGYQPETVFSTNQFQIVNGEKVPLIGNTSFTTNIMPTEGAVFETLLYVTRKLTDEEAAKKLKKAMIWTQKEMDMNKEAFEDAETKDE